MKSKTGAVDNSILSKKTRREERDKLIRKMYRSKQHYSMQEIADILDVGKTTVFFAIHGGR